MKGNPKKEFRRYAAASLGAIGIPAIDPVICAMASDDRELRGFLSLALCRIGKPAVEPLTRRLDDADEIIRSCATLTLWQMGEMGLPAILDTIEKEEQSANTFQLSNLFFRILTRTDKSAPTKILPVCLCSLQQWRHMKNR
jgi:HEAT repeat protein